MEDILRLNRPGISESSIKTYVSLLRSIPDAYDVENCLQIICSKPLLTKKTILSALYAYTLLEIYKEEIHKCITEVKLITDKQQQNEKQRRNYLSTEEVELLYEKYKNIFECETSSRYEKQDYIILCLICGKFFPPRRLLDWTEFKVNNISRSEDNYAHSGKFVFNKFKTCRHYGQQQVEIPDDFQAILTKWKSLIDSDYLLTNSIGKKLTSISLHKRINKLVGKKAGINTFRHL